MPVEIKPILFNTEMVRALLEGRKTVTPRVVKGYALEHLEIDTDGSIIGVYDQFEGCARPVVDFAPYRPRDILYVRETWRVRNVYGDFKYGNRTAEIEFKAGGEYAYMRVQEDSINERKWRPSIHMPKEAARLFLRVTDVRVERLLDSFVAQGDTIIALRDEGIDIGDHCRQCIENYGNPCCNDLDPELEVDENGEDENGGSECGMLDEIRTEFSHLWDSTIKPADLPLYAWDANPWVWVVEFEKTKKEALERGNHA